MLPERPQSLWSQTATDLSTWPPLTEAISVDVVVIGGGFTGVSAAYHLALEGASVALLEARTIGFGGSGRNFGLVNAGLWTPPDEVEDALGKDTGARLNAALAEGPSLVFDLIEHCQIRCEAVRKGTLHCAHARSGLRDLERRFAQQASRGAPVKRLDKDETRRRTGSPAYLGALWDGRAGTIQPLAYVQGLARAAAAQGAQLFEASAVLDLQETGGTWTATTEHGSVTAGRLIQATNAYGTAATTENQIIPMHYFQVATAPLPLEIRQTILGGGEGCWDTATIMSSFRLDAAGRLIFGALGNLDGFGGAAHRAWARRKVDQLFPQARDIPFQQSWTGRIAMTGSHLPRVERRGRGGISIFGYSGRGIAPGTVFGRAAARWALGKEDMLLPVEAPRAEPRSTAKSLFYEAGATLSHLGGGRL